MPRNRIGGGVVILIVVGFGALIFIILAVMLGNTINKAFRSYENSENTLERMMTAFEEMNSANTGTVKLLQVIMDDESLFVGFKPNKNISIFYKKLPFGTGGNSVEVLERPFECGSSMLNRTCVCLCKGFSLKFSELAGGTRGAHRMECDEIQCTYADPGNITLKEKTFIKNILDEGQYLHEGYEEDYFENGFMIFKTRESHAQTSAVSYNIYPYTNFQTKYTDILIVKNNDGLSICFKNECKAS